MRLLQGIDVLPVGISEVLGHRSTGSIFEDLLQRDNLSSFIFIFYFYCYFYFIYLFIGDTFVSMLDIHDIRGGRGDHSERDVKAQ